MSTETEPPANAIDLGPAALGEIDAIIELMSLRPPAYWMHSVSQVGMKAFLRYTIESSRAVLLAARPKDAAAPIGYLFAVVDSKRFWLGFAFRKPVLTVSIMIHRLRRLYELRGRSERRASSSADAASGLPQFSWAPARLGYARIIGVYVRKEHRHQGIAMYLYFSLFDLLKRKGCPGVEEYAAADYADWAGKFPEVCGWNLQPCACGGYKITRAL